MSSGLALRIDQCGGIEHLRWGEEWCSSQSEIGVGSGEVDDLTWESGMVPFVVEVNHILQSGEDAIVHVALMLADFTNRDDLHAPVGGWSARCRLEKVSQANVDVVRPQRIEAVGIDGRIDVGVVRIPDVPWHADVGEAELRECLIGSRVVALRAEGGSGEQLEPASLLSGESGLAFPDRVVFGRIGGNFVAFLIGDDGVGDERKDAVDRLIESPVSVDVEELTGVGSEQNLLNDEFGRRRPVFMQVIHLVRVEERVTALNHVRENTELPARLFLRRGGAAVPEQTAHVGLQVFTVLWRSSRVVLDHDDGGGPSVAGASEHPLHDVVVAETFAGDVAGSTGNSAGVGQSGVEENLFAQLNLAGVEHGRGDRRGSGLPTRLGNGLAAGARLGRCRLARGARASWCGFGSGLAKSRGCSV